MNEESLRMLEELFNSMSTITQQELNSVQFDRTVVAKIVKKYEDSQTKYQVSTDNLKFDAYAQSDSARYAEGSSVYILIPDGDYSNNKLILGRYGEEDSSPRLLFTSPLDQIISTQKLSYDTPTTLEVNSGAQVSTIECVTFNNLNIIKNGIKDIDTICLDFSLTTQGLEGSITGDYCVFLDFYDSDNNSLLNSELRTLLTIYSSQLNGNPYDLMQGIRFQFAFPFPLINEGYAFTDLTKIKYVKISLASNNNFDGINTNGASITLNDISVYMGVTGEVMSQTQSTISLTLDNTDNKEYETNADIKQMSIDWFRSGNNVIYSEAEGYQYPKDDEYYIYWLQYSASDAYTKDLTKDDIKESGTYWKTVQKQDASIASAYTYTANNLDYKRYEEVFKVGIRSKDGTSYIESTPITFTNKSYDKTIGSNTGVPDTLTLTLSDSGVYNNYGIDNKLLGSNTNRTVIVTYVNNAITWQNQGPCTITWEIPAVATMIQIPKVKDKESGNYIEDSRWEKKENVYQYTINNPTDTDTTGKTINYQLQQQFGFNKTNNKIKCTITRYEDKEHKRPIDTYSGSITLQFGTQGTSGSEYAFNIRPRRPGALTGTKSITFDTTLETNDGSPVTFDGTKVKWSVMYGDKEADLKNGDNTITGTTINISDSTAYPAGYNKYYSILVATLSGFTDTNGKTINLKAYYPIPYSKSEEAANYYISGASRIVYNYQGTSPNYDSTPYRLYNENGAEIPVAQWSIRFPKWNEKDNYTDKNKTIPNGNWQNYPSLEMVKVDGKEEHKLKPLSNIQSNILACNVTAYNKTIGATDSEEDRTNAILWAQPLLIIRNNYTFPLINSWDGSLTIDEEGNYILTELIGAGTKDKDNKYTGVLMGAIGKAGAAATTGIYGFSDGVLRYKLDEKGSFYVGTGNDNFISFNEGINGRSNSEELMIKTNKFNLDTTNLKINSDEGIKLNTSNDSFHFIIDAKKKTVDIKGAITATSLTLNATVAAQAGIATSTQVQKAQKAADDAQTTAQNNALTFTTVQLSNGTRVTQAKNKNGTVVSSTIAYAGSGYVLSSVGQTDSDKYVKIGTDGLLEANNAIIHGTVYANKGQIGGWTLEDYMLYAGSNSINSSYFYILSKPDSNNGYIGAKDKSGSWCFKVDNDGHLHATGATITGTLTAGAGSKIGGWVLDDHLFYKTNGTYTMGFDFNEVGNTGRCFAIGRIPATGSWANAAFYVTGQGKLYASGAEIGGDTTVRGTFIADNFQSREGSSMSWTIDEIQVHAGKPATSSVFLSGLFFGIQGFPPDQSLICLGDTGITVIKASAITFEEESNPNVMRKIRVEGKGTNVSNYYNHYTWTQICNEEIKEIK